MDFKWTIQKLVVAPQQNGKVNVVIQAEWLCTAIDDVNKLQAAASGRKNFDLGDNFIDFDKLTESQVLDWCFAPKIITFEDNTTVTKMLKDEGEAQASEQIARQLAQKESEPSLPWL
jgi:hypothetical protein